MVACINRGFEMGLRLNVWWLASWRMPGAALSGGVRSSSTAIAGMKKRVSQARLIAHLSEYWFDAPWCTRYDGLKGKRS